jgi:hypothetical protein
MTVVGNHIARLRRLEAAIAPASRWFLVRERDGDIEGQVRRLRDEEGVTDRDLLVILRSEDATPRGDREALWINTGVPRSEGFGR